MFDHPGYRYCSRRKPKNPANISDYGKRAGGVSGYPTPESAGAGTAQPLQIAGLQPLPILTAIYLSPDFNISPTLPASYPTFLTSAAPTMSYTPPYQQTTVTTTLDSPSGILKPVTVQNLEAQGLI